MIEPAGLLWGSERALLDFLANVDDERFDMIVACPSESPLREELQRIGITTVDAPLELLHLRGRLARLRAASALARIIQRIAPDVVHVNQAGLLRIAAVACRFLRTPIMCHVRLLEDARRLRARPPTRLRPQRYVAVSDGVRAELVTDEGRAGVPVSRIYDPFDGDKFRRDAEAQPPPDLRVEFSIPTHMKVIALVGRVCADKRQELLIEAAGILGGDDLFYLIVGGEPITRSGTSSYREFLENRADHLGIRRKVRFTGLRADVPSIMRMCDALVLTSEEEAFGRVLLEALCLGKPVIGPDGGGPAEIIGHDERGLTFKVGSASSLAACIRATFANPESAEARTNRGKKWVRETCSPDHHAREIEQLYEELGATRRRATTIHCF